MAIIKEIKEDDVNLEKCFEGAEKILELNADTDIDQIEAFFKDNEDGECEDNSPTEAEKVMFQEDMHKFKEGVAKEREKYQPTTGEKIFAVVKSIILRALAFYIIMWFFKRNSTPGGIPYGVKYSPPSDSLGEDEEDFVSYPTSDLKDEL